MDGWFFVFSGLVFWAALITSLIIYLTKRKWYPVFYIVSICLYVFTAGYVIDAYDMNKDQIFIILGFSAFVMIGAGVYIAKKFAEKKVVEVDEPVETATEEKPAVEVAVEETAKPEKKSVVKKSKKN